MADISREPGKLNILSMRKGYPFTFQAVYDGDITADTFVATIYNDNGTTVPLGVTAVYVGGTTLKTTLTFTLTAVNSALLQAGTQYWEMVRTTGGASFPELAGSWGVNDRTS